MAHSPSEGGVITSEWNTLTRTSLGLGLSFSQFKCLFWGKKMLQLKKGSLEKLVPHLIFNQLNQIDFALV